MDMGKLGGGGGWASLAWGRRRGLSVLWGGEGEGCGEKERERKRGITFLTTGSTQGFESSSLYAPTPRLIFCGNVSALYAAVNLKILFTVVGVHVSELERC